MFNLGKKSVTPIKDPEGIAIKVMPDEFYFKKGNMSRPANEEPKTTSPRPAPSPISPLPGAAPVEHKKPTLIIILIACTILLIGSAAYLFIQSLNLGKEPVASEPVVEKTEPVKEPSAPVCGDGRCEEGENSTSCLSDCPLPLAPEPPTPVVLPTAFDNDDDGLTDVEEDLFGVNAKNEDTDSDGYRDGLEVINLYNPSGFAPQKIEETSLVKIYSNPSYNFNIFYPTNWLAKALDETNQEVMFTSATGEFIQIIVEENKDSLPLLDWYLIKAPGVRPAEVGTVATKSGLLGIRSPDGLTAYFSFENKIFAISYNVGVKTELNYKSTFEMMVKSFKIRAGKD